MTLADAQITQLLKPINPSRVGTDGKGFSHVEAYEIRAHLTRIFGFARWSEEVTDQALIFESSEPRKNKKGDDYTAWTVAYRSMVRLTIHGPDGETLAVYTEGATGDASNQPSRADAHDLALKTSQSQALKRAAANLGDQFGLSLYRRGSTEALVRGLILPPDSSPQTEAVDAHVTDSPSENLLVEVHRVGQLCGIATPEELSARFAEVNGGLVLSDATQPELRAFLEYLHEDRKRGNREHKRLVADVNDTTQAGHVRKDSPDRGRVERGPAEEDAWAS